MQGWEDDALGSGGAGPGSLYVGSLAPDVDDATLAEAFGACGAVLSAVVWRDQSTGQSLCQGSVTFATAGEARFAIDTLNGRQLGGRALEVRLAAADGRPAGGVLPQPPYPSAPPAGADAPGGDVGPSPNLYIKGLPPGTTDVGLRNVFTPFGAILDSRILYPQSAAPSALLRYSAVQEAGAAIAAMHNVTPPGATNALQVRFAESQADKARRGTRAPGDLPGPRAPAPALPSGAEAVERVECPHNLVGWLIGRGGETIRGLQTRSGSAISIEQNLPEGVPRIVLITGNREQVALGRQLIEELLVSGAARGGGTWPGGGAPGGGAQPAAPGGGGGGGAQQWGGRNDWGPGQQQQQQQALQGGAQGAGVAMQPGLKPPGGRAPAEEVEEEAEPESPVFDAEEVQAAKDAAAERAGDLPPELRFADAPLPHLATLAARRAGRGVPVPSKPDARARSSLGAALRELCLASQHGVAPSLALLSALTEAASHLASGADWAFGLSHDAEAAGDKAEETSVARAVVRCASHLAAPPVFARYSGCSDRCTALGAAGVAAAALLCADESRCVRFFAAGGAAILASVACWNETPACVRTSAGQALARATRYASACAFFIDEWRCGDAVLHEAPLASVAQLLLSPQQPSLAQHVMAVLVRCHVCRLSWHLRAAAEGAASCSDEVDALALLLLQQRSSNAAPELSATESSGSDAALANEVPTLGLLADTRALPSLAAAVRQAGDDAPRLASSVGALLRELASSRHGLYVLASEATAAVELAGALGGDAAPLVRSALLGVTALEALLQGEGDAVLLGALHSLVRLTRDAPSRECAALLLAAPGALDRLLDVMSAPPSPAAPNDPSSLTHGIALELLLALLSDGRVETMGAWVPHVSRVSAVVDKVESATSPVTWPLVRDWLAAGARLHERSSAGLLAWLSALVLNGDAGGPSAGDAAPALVGDAQPAAGAASFAPLSAGSRVGVLCALRMLASAAHSSTDAAVTLFGMDALGVVAALLRRTSDVLACCGASGADDAAALDEDMDAGPALAACRRFIRAADISAAAAQLARPLLEQLRAGGVAEYRSAALVGALSAAHAASAVQHAAGGPLSAAACSVRVACASALAYWATGAPAWQPRVLHSSLGDAEMTPRAALSSALLIADLLPPAGHPQQLSSEALAQLSCDLQPAALAAVLRSAATSASARLNAAAVQALARVAALGEEHAACVATACVAASAPQADGESAAPSQMSRALQLLTGAADATDAAEVAAALRSRLAADGDVSPEDSAPAAYVEAQFPAPVEAAFMSVDLPLVSWRMPRDGLRFADDSAKRKRIVRAEVRAKRTKSDTTGAAPRHAPAAQPPPMRRKHASGVGRTMHVDEFQARQAALKGIPAAEAAPALPPPPPAAAPTPPVVAAPVAAGAAKMLSIRLGALGAAAPAAAAVTASVAEAAVAPAFDLNRWEPDLQFEQQQAEEAAPPVAAPPPFVQAAPAPSLYAPPPMIPGLGGFSAAPAAAPPMIPGLGFAAAPPPAFVPPRAAIPPPQPPAGPKPPAGPPPQQSWSQVAQPAQPAWEQVSQVQPTAALMQQLSSPEAITQLLNDPTRLAALLAQFPALATMLQARLQGGAR